MEQTFVYRSRIEAPLEQVFGWHLRPGAFFGEMSLLTGAPRGATVTATVDSIVFEIGKESLQPIIARREALAEAISRVLAERQMGNVKASDTPAADGDHDATHGSLAAQLLGRMRSFFGLAASREAAAALQ